MKRKMLLIIIGIVGIVALILVGWYVMFVHFGRGPTFPFLVAKEIDKSNIMPLELAEDQLTALTDTEEQAQEIAEQYGITLVSYEMGVAVYHTEEDPLEVIARGQEKGYPALSPNFVQSIYGDEQIGE